VVESDELGVAQLKYPASEPIFVYDNKTGEKISDYRIDNDRLILD
jgi:hypothetical protein